MSATVSSDAIVNVALRRISEAIEAKNMCVVGVWGWGTLQTRAES